MENLGLTAIWAVCLCIVGLLLGIAIVLLVQWYARQQVQPAPTRNSPASLPVHERPAQAASSRPAVSWLIMAQGPDRGRSILLDQPVMGIGRDPANEIVIEHPQVSRFHARFSWENARVYLEDLGSSNGTFINQERIADRRMLRNGDGIGLGIVVLFTFYQ